MKSFMMWLETKEKNIRDTVLQLLGLDDDGLETPLANLNADHMLSKLEPLGMWNSMPAGKKNEIHQMVKQQLGTVGELIDKICDLGDNEVETPGVMPPREEF
jgi:hypothetical protein